MDFTKCTIFKNYQKRNAARIRRRSERKRSAYRSSKGIGTPYLHTGGSGSAGLGFTTIGSSC